jgi:hypothetical protein
MHYLLAQWVSGTTLDDERYDNRFMARGRALEDAAIAAYETLADEETQQGGFWTLDSGLVGCSPDRLVGASGLLEIKCVILSTQVGCALEGVEADHVAQTQGQMWITERDYCDVFSYHPALVLPPKRVARDEKYIQEASRLVGDFVDEMLRFRKDLEREYGPFTRPGEEGKTSPASDFFTEEDVEFLIRKARGI